MKILKKWSALKPKLQIHNSSIPTIDISEVVLVKATSIPHLTAADSFNSSRRSSLWSLQRVSSVASHCRSAAYVLSIVIVYTITWAPIFGYFTIGSLFSQKNPISYTHQDTYHLNMTFQIRKCFYILHCTNLGDDPSK